VGFLWGYLIGRSLNSGPRRKAAPGTALPIYGGALMVGLGLLCLSRPWGGWLALAGLLFCVVGLILDKIFVSEQRYRQQWLEQQHYQQQQQYYQQQQPYQPYVSLHKPPHDRSRRDNLVAAFGMSLLTLCVLIAIAVAAIGFTKHRTLLPAPAVTQQINPQSSAVVIDGFQSGVTARQEWESWFSGLSGDYRAGAEYWASQRSKLKPGSCRAADGTSRGPFTEGCEAAQQMLATSDFRRKSDPDYRRGWNSPPARN
jgi:hypothetical protein